MWPNRCNMANFMSRYSSKLLTRSCWATSWASTNSRSSMRTAHYDSGHPHMAAACLKSSGSSCSPILWSVMWAMATVGVPVGWTRLCSTCRSSIWAWRRAWKCSPDLSLAQGGPDVASGGCRLGFDDGSMTSHFPQSLGMEGTTLKKSDFTHLLNDVLILENF